MAVCAAIIAVGLVGCSWDTGSDADSWSSSYDWVNFSGVYRGVSGGLLVTDYTTTPSIPGSTNIVSVKNESQTSISLNQTEYAGKLSKTPIVPGSVALDFGYFSASDDGNGILTGPMGDGTISYTSGAWTYSGAAAAVAAGTVRATYSQYISNTGSAGSGAVPGSTRFSIYSFNLSHQGQKLTITDNNGAIFTGHIKKMQSTSGYQNTDISQVGANEQRNDSLLAAKLTYQESPLPENGDTIVANFECSGTSAAGIPVRIVGTLQGTVAAGVFSGRRMDGTWIEVGGKTGDINAVTTSVPVTSIPGDIPADSFWFW